MPKISQNISTYFKYTEIIRTYLKYMNIFFKIHVLEIAGALVHLRMFGVNPKLQPAINYQHELLPEPYVAIRDSKVLQSNASRCLSLLSAENSRNFLIIMDETYWHPTQDVTVNLRSDSKLALIGGWFTEQEDEGIDRT